MEFKKRGKNSTKQSTRTKTYEEHPKPQCALDTLVAGALCIKQLGNSTNDDVIVSDEQLCLQSINNQENVGVRPSCWMENFTYNENLK